MINTVRTTIRIRKDLFDQSRLLALERDTSLQEVINDTLIRGFGYITDMDRHKEAMAAIDTFRESMRGKKIRLQKLLEQNKKDQK
jgi:hypothetical protein